MAPLRRGTKNSDTETSLGSVSEQVDVRYPRQVPLVRKKNENPEGIDVDAQGKKRTGANKCYDIM